MTKPKYRQSLVLLGRRTSILLLAVILSFATLLASLTSQHASAAQMTNRSVVISSSVGGLTAVGYDFTFSWIAGSTVNSAVLQFCDAPLGTCTLPNSMNIDPSTLTSLGGTTGFPGSNAFSEYAGADAGACTDHNAGAASTQFCISRTADAATTAGSGATVALDGVTNPTIPGGQNFETVFVRVTLYSDDAFATQVHDGTVAAAIVRQLTTTGRVQERLEFCVAAVAETTWDTSYPADCTDNAGADAWPTTTNIDLGVIDNLNVAISPVNNTTTNPANDSFGIAMVDTNASNGVNITYFPEQATNVSGGDTDQLRSFRVLPTDCAAAATTLTDQCFQSAGTTAVDITAGGELFGIYVACRIASTGTTGGNLTVPTDYDGEDGTITEAAGCETEAAGGDGTYDVAFRDDGTPASIGTSTTVVDDEILVIRFAATAQSTTPTGQYTVVTTYIATPTY